MELKALVKDIAPALGSVLMGPLGGVAMSFIAEKLGVEEKTVQAVTTALSDGKLTPEQVSSLKLAELDFKKFCEEKEIDYVRIAEADRASAREMQISTQSIMPAVLTSLVTVGFFGILALLFFHPELKGNEIIMIMVGQLSTVWAGCVAFYVGTTHGSAQKTNLLAQSTPAK